MGRENKYRTAVELDTEAMSVNVAIIDKATKETVSSEVFAAAEIHDSCKQKVALYGYSKLLQDRASDVEIGPAKLEAMRSVAAQLASGQWAKERKIGAIVTSPEVEALAALKEISVPAAQAALKAYPKEIRAQILASAAVVAKAAEIREAREGQEVTSLDDFVPEGVSVEAAPPQAEAADPAE